MFSKLSKGDAGSKYLVLNNDNKKITPAIQSDFQKRFYGTLSNKDIYRIVILQKKYKYEQSKLSILFVNSYAHGQNISCLVRYSITIKY